MRASFRVASSVLVAAVVLAACSSFAGCNRPKQEREPSASKPAPPGATQTLKALRGRHGRLVMLGFDGVDPRWLDRFMQEGKLPALAKLTAAHDGQAYRRLRSTNPPQSPVAWTSFATGTEPGEHGIYDFIGRSFGSGDLPVLPKVATSSFEVQSAGPPVARNLRTGQPFWQLLGNAGVRVVALNVPYSFPPEPMREGRMLSGLGVPDLRETNSTFTYAGTDVTAEEAKRPPGGGVLVPLALSGDRGRFDLDGPSVPGADGKRMSVPVEIVRGTPEGGASVTVAGKTVALEVGRFSEWVELEFRHGEIAVSGIAKLLLLEAGKRTRLFITPISMHPRRPYSPFSFPKAFSAQLADELGGLYKTVGWDHDTSALNAEVIDEAAFLQDLESIEGQRRQMLMQRLAVDDWDLLIWVSTATDRVPHMFYRLIDPEHPRYDAALAARFGDAIEKEYRRMDDTVAAVLEKLRPDDTLLILSDHGFHNYRRGLHVNQWLRRNGLLVLKNGASSAEREFFMDVDWSKTKAYALGTGQIYLNRQGREPKGIVTDEQATQVLAQVRDGLLALRDEERGGAKVVDEVYFGAEVYQGGRAEDRPDAQVAFAEHYRTSWETILGGVPAALFADNNKKWSGDHAASDVRQTPGILIGNRPIARTDPAIVDLAPTAVAFFEQDLPAHYAGKPLLSLPEHKP
jgi:predicted AlkP superfamily phosphohydrolase/phosphomutase